jgi:hypothetical protein
MKITIATSESGTRSANVDYANAETHLAANDCFANEAFLLLAFIAADGIPASIEDLDGDKWALAERDDESGSYTYEMQ